MASNDHGGQDRVGDRQTEEDRTAGSAGGCRGAALHSGQFLGASRARTCYDVQHPFDSDQRETEVSNSPASSTIPSLRVASLAVRADACLA